MRSDVDESVAVPVRAGERPRTVERHDFAVLVAVRQLFRHSETMRGVERLVLKAADADSPILIEGETGTGKEMIAEALHALSARANSPWIKVRCSALPEELLDAELFGHDVRDFGGAPTERPGAFERARRGTVFLDGIGELPARLQAKLLHYLQDSTFFRVGGRDPIASDARVITASATDLSAAVSAGAFREDLYYRLNVVRIVVPPLRERPEEILPLVEHFRGECAQRFQRPCPPLSDATTELLVGYAWPGNVRELENFMKRYAVLGDERHLQNELRERLATVGPQTDAVLSAVAAGEGLRGIAKRAAREAERSAINAMLVEVRWNRAEAARRLKISYKTLLVKLQEGGLAPSARRGTSQ